MNIFWAILLIILIIYTIYVYNKFVYYRNLIKQAEADIDVFLKKRHDLLNKLVDTVNAYADFEKSTLEKIVKARNLALQNSLKDTLRNEREITESLKTFFALAENYPDLKANRNFLDLQKNITKVEEDLQKARRFYNGAVQAYNTYIEQFPQIILAKMLNFKPEEFFDLDTEA